jgi:phenylpropionate dioxygenase-like ring-hydroxylating dioxygenase large terminal subunit
MFQHIKEIAEAPMQTACSLPFEAYSSKEYYKLEKEHIFQDEWVFVCHEKQIANEGEFINLTIADESVLIVRGNDRKVRALSNVCRHRGTKLTCETKGKCKKFICPYHAWRYGDNGELLGATFTHKDELNKNIHHLHQFNLEVWQGLVFVNLSGTAQPLGDRYREVEKHLKQFNYSACTKAFEAPSEQWASNWKLAVENGIESYHLFMVHKETLETITPTKEAFYLEGGKDFSVTAGKMKSVHGNLKEWIFGKNQTKNYYILLFLAPNFVGILTYESLSWIAIFPTQAENCEVHIAGVNPYGIRGSKDEQEFTQAFLTEDKEICEMVQTNMRSHYAKGGKLLEIERIVVDFHHYIASRLFNSDVEPYYISQEAKEWKNRN